MKSLKTITVIVFSLFLGLSNVQAQEKTEVKEKPELTEKPELKDRSEVKNFTAEQKQLLQERRELMAKNREAFKASLTAEQLAILNNKDLNKKEQHAALVLTFTTAQKAILAKNRESVEVLKKDFKATLTAEQHKELHSEKEHKIRETIKESKGRNKKGN